MYITQIIYFINIFLLTDWLKVFHVTKNSSTVNIQKYYLLVFMVKSVNSIYYLTDNLDSCVAVQLLHLHAVTLEPLMAVYICIL